MQCRYCGKGFETSDKRVRYCERCIPNRPALKQRLRRRRIAALPVMCSRCGTNARHKKSHHCDECRRILRNEKRMVWERVSHREPCPDCGRLKWKGKSRCQSCAKKQDANRGANNPAWKGGRTVHSSGHVRVRIDGVYVLEHRHVWEQANGPIPKNWHVHHLNGVKVDNRLENLVAMDKSQHHKNHHEPWENRIRALEARIRELGG